MMKFTKMQAFGNDYVYIDAIHQELKNLPELARFVSDRHFAIGSDGMVLICPSDKGDFRMRMFNPDGTEGEMCGNALRSVGKYVYDHRLTDKTELVIETLGGMQHLTLTVTDGYVSNIRADIGEPRLSTKVIPINTEMDTFVDQPVQVLDRTFHITAVSWGNPHCAMFVDSVAELDVEKYGKEIEHMTSTFLLPLTMGACTALGGNVVTDAFGVVALVALAPLIAIQIMGLVYEHKLKKSSGIPKPALEDTIIELEDEEV